MVAITQDTTVQPGGVIHIHSDQLPIGALPHVTVLIDQASNDVNRTKKDPITHPPRVPGLWKGKVWIADDFNDPLPDSFWLDES